MKWLNAMLGGHPFLLMMFNFYHNILFCVKFFFHILWIGAGKSRSGAIPLEVHFRGVREYNEGIVCLIVAHFEPGAG